MVGVWHQSTARTIRKPRIHLLSYRSRGTLMSYTDHSAQRRLKSNAPCESLTNNEQVTWIRCVWLRRHEKCAALGVLQECGWEPLWSMKKGPCLVHCFFSVIRHFLIYLMISYEAFSWRTDMTYSLFRNCKKTTTINTNGLNQRFSIPEYVSLMASDVCTIRTYSAQHK